MTTTRLPASPAEPKQVSPADITKRQMLTEKEVAERQGRAVKTLQNQRVTGDGIPFLKLGHAVRYRLADVEAWEAARLRTSTSDTGETR